MCDAMLCVHLKYSILALIYSAKLLNYIFITFPFRFSSQYIRKTWLLRLSSETETLQTHPQQPIQQQISGAPPLMNKGLSTVLSETNILQHPIETKERHKNSWMKVEQYVTSESM